MGSFYYVCNLENVKKLLKKLKLAVSIYYKPEDIWEIPNLIL